MPENLVTKCPGCGAGYRLKDASAAGKAMKCRKCQQTFIVTLPAAKKPASRPEPDEFGEFDEGDFDDFGSAAGARGQDLFTSPKQKSAGGTKSASKSKKKSGSDGKSKPRKKSKRNKQEKGGINAVTIAGGAVVLLVMVIAGAILLKPGGEKRIEPPSSYAKFQHPINNLFTCEYPSDWEGKHGGQAGSVIWAQFEMGKAKIEIRQGASGGALGDIFGAASPNPNAPEDQTPVARLHDHEIMKNEVAKDFDDYSEQEARTVKTGMGNARVSQFSAAGKWGKRITGFRGTILGGGGKQLRVVARCPEADWDVCKVIFERMIGSIQ